MIEPPSADLLKNVSPPVPKCISKTLSNSLSANRRGEKLSKSFLQNHSVFERGEPPMWIKLATFVGSMAALLR